MGDGNGRHEGLKCCANCKEWLPIDAEHFTKDKRRPDGLCPYCRVCAQMRTFLYQRRNGIIKKPVVVSEEEKRARYLASKRRDYVKHQQAYIERSRKWRADHPGATTIQGRIWRAKNREHVRVTGLVRERVRRARKKANKGDVFTSEDLMSLVKQQDGKCYYCSCLLTDKIEFDHMVPLSRGGEHSIANLCASCRPCNRRKHNLTADEFKENLKLRGVSS